MNFQNADSNIGYTATNNIENPTTNFEVDVLRANLQRNMSAPKIAPAETLVNQPATNVNINITHAL